MKTRFQFRHVNELTGLFVLLTLVGAGITIVVTARSRHWFAAKTEFQLQLPHTGASGLKPGNDVIVLGLPAGIVTDVIVRPDGELAATISLRRDYAQFVHTDSQATIKKIYGVAGDSFVEFTRGESGKPLADGSLIVCRSTDELPSVVDRLMGEVQPLIGKATGLLDEWTRLAAGINERQSELARTMKRLDHIVARVESGEGSVGRLLHDPGAVDDAQKVLREAQVSLAELRVVLTHVKESTAQLPAVTENLRQATAPLPSITRAVAAEAEDLPGTLLRVQKLVEELDRLTVAAQRTWLLRGHVEPRKDGPRIPPHRLP